MIIISVKIWQKGLRSINFAHFWYPLVKPSHNSASRSGLMGPRPKSHEISLKNLPILKIHAEDMKLIVDAILRRSQEEL